MAAKRKILVTSALPYANGPLHLGHMVGYIQADIWVRLQKMLNHDCLYISGSDAHGTPIMIQAEKMGLAPAKMVEEMRKDQQKIFTEFAIGFDNYYTTHSPENEALVELIFKRHLEAGNITKATIKQLFDPSKNLFLPDRYVKGECPNCGAKDQYGDNCEVCGATYSPTELKNPYSVLSGTKPIEKESLHYFFKLQNYTDFLKEWTKRGHLQAEVSNKLDEWFNDGLREWDISRDAPYFGFKIPGEENKYFYVWLDAPIGYIASFKNLCERSSQLSFEEYWGEESEVELYHFIGKDIIYFHALFWPAILAGAKFRTPTAIFANGFLTINGQKMSKSRGTFIKASTYLQFLPSEYLRYYFAAKLSDRIEDLDINFDDFTKRINADLVGKFINIASRSASFINKHFNNQLSATCLDKTLYANFAKAGDEILEKWNKLEYSHAIRQIMALADKANQYIDEQKPWALIKEEKNHEKVQTICSMAINLFRILMIYLKPVLPKTAEEVELFLNIAPLNWEDKETPLLNHTINEYLPLLNRIDPKQIEELKMTLKDESKEKETAKSLPDTALTKPELISIEEFNKIDLRVAKVLQAEVVDGADKLLRLKVDLGNETRQIFAGIKASYAPETLVGRQVIIVANLAPRKMRFGVSEGMVIVAGNEGELWIVSPDNGAEPGMKVK